MSNPDEPTALPHAVARFLAAVREQRDADAARIVQELPSLAAHDARVAVVLGDDARVRATIATDPAWATRPSDPEAWPPLMYAASSFLHRIPAGDTALARVTGSLLAAGASPNTAVAWVPSDPSVMLSALSFAATRGSVGVTRALLAAGADPNDGESLYHAAQGDHRECLELLLAHGADISGAHPRWGNTPLFFLAGHSAGHPTTVTADRGMAWLLAHGADPRVPSGPRGESPLHALVRAGRTGPPFDLLLAHGAVLDAPRADGVTPLGLAVRGSRTTVVEDLRARGADPSRITAADRFLGACLAGDGDAAEAARRDDPTLPDSLGSEAGAALVQAAARGDLTAVQFMLGKGFSPASSGDGPGTPLHHAAWHGQVECVRALLAHDAPVNARDERYGSSPIAWAVHGSVFAMPDDARYLAVVDLLLDAGAERASSINRWGEAPEDMGNAVLAARLRERGFAPQA